MPSNAIMLLSTRLAPAVNTVGHNFGDKTKVDDIPLLLVIIDILHANGDQMSVDNLLNALKHYGVPSKEFFKEKYFLSFEDWLSRFIHYLNLSKGIITLSNYCKDPPRAKIIKAKKRDTILHKLEQLMNHNGGVAPNIQQFVNLCRKEAKLDLHYITAKLNLPNNPSLSIQWLLPQIVEIRCGVNHGVYPAPHAARTKHHSWKAPPEPLSASSAAICAQAPPANGTETAKSEIGTAGTEPANPKDETATEAKNKFENESEAGIESKDKFEKEPKGVENETITPDGEIETQPKGVEIEPTAIRIELTNSTTLLEKPQMPPGIKFSLSFDDESQPLYSEMKRAKIMTKKAASSDEEVLLVLGCLPPEYSKAIVPYILSNPSYLQAIILDHGNEILLKYVDKTQENVENIEVNIQQVLESTNKALGLYAEQSSNNDSLPRKISTADTKPRKINKNKLSDMWVACNSRGEIYNITFRVSRFVPDSACLICDVTNTISGKKPKSLLVLGTSGSGKTTLLCEVARLLSKKKNKNIRVVDRNNEMGGDNAMAHARIGAARRQRSNLPLSALVREATQNHYADVVVVDGISTREEAQEVCAAMRRGVTVVASVHSQCATLRSLYEDEELGDLLCHPTKALFDIAIEIPKVNSMRVHHDLRKSIAALRAGKPPAFEKRWISAKTGAVLARLEDPEWKPEFPKEVDLSFVEPAHNGGERGNEEEDEEEWVEGYVEEEEGYGGYGEEEEGGEEKGEEGYGYEEYHRTQGRFVAAG